MIHAQNEMFMFNIIKFENVNYFVQANNLKDNKNLFNLFKKLNLSSLKARQVSKSKSISWVNKKKF